MIASIETDFLNPDLQVIVRVSARMILNKRSCITDRDLVIGQNVHRLTVQKEFSHSTDQCSIIKFTYRRNRILQADSFLFKD